MYMNENTISDARSLGRLKVFILGVQHLFAMFGATILVPILVSGYFQQACGEPLTSGLGFSDGLTFTVGNTPITLTSLAIAAIAGVLLNAILPGNTYEFGVHPEGDQSRGVFMKNKD